MYYAVIPILEPCYTYNPKENIKKLRISLTYAVKQVYNNIITAELDIQIFC